MSLIQQSSIPTFINENSICTQLANKTILFCTSFNGERENFIVVDADSIRNNYPSSIQVCFNNGWIIPLISNTQQKKYTWEMTTNDINVHDNICLYQDILKIRDNLKVIVNGSEWTQWDFLDRRQYENNTFGDYCQHIQFTTVPGPNLSLVIEYTENVSKHPDYKMTLYRQDNNSVQNKMLPLTMTDANSNQYYLDSVTINDNFTSSCTYKNFDGTSPDAVVDKRFSDSVRVVQFQEGWPITNFGYVLEMWKTVDHKSGGDTGRYPGYSSQYGNMLLHKTFDHNRIEFIGNNIRLGTYKFRIRNTVTGEVSDWMNTLKIKKITVFTTDITLSNKTYQGFLYSPKFV